MNIQFKKRIFNLEDEKDQQFIEWKDVHLHHILPSNIKKYIHYDVKVRPFEYLKGMIYMNSVLEDQERKLFQPIPLRTDIIPKYITLDTASLVNEKGRKIHRLLVCRGHGCVSSQNKKAVFKTRDLNSAVNILNLTKTWLDRKERPAEFCHKLRSSPIVSPTREDKVEP